MTSFEAISKRSRSDSPRFFQGHRRSSAAAEASASPNVCVAELLPDVPFSSAPRGDPAVVPTLLREEDLLRFLSAGRKREQKARASAAGASLDVSLILENCIHHQHSVSRAL